MTQLSGPPPEVEPVPPALLSANPLRWMAIFGPGAVIASLTIGVGELVFSSRAGAIFGYRILWFFLVVLLLKWVLVFTSARHIVLTGAHPFQRWMSLPGPAGWLPILFLVLAVPCFPVWVCFHAGTVGTLVAHLTGTTDALRGGAHLLWGLGVLGVVLLLCSSGGYAALERVQLAIVVLMLASVAVAVLFIHPDWAEFIRGTFVPQPLAYPSWITMETHREVASRPVWLEVATYVGVIGGSSYDYLAYVSYLRDKRWGRAGGRVDSYKSAAGAAAFDPRWLRAPLIDCALSFVAVILFCAVFVICGAAVLGPQHKVPGGSNLLALQAEFVSSVHPLLKHVYFVGAFLAIFGTLYGTIEVAPTILREMALALYPNHPASWASRLRRYSVAWCGFGGAAILIWSLWRHLQGGQGQPPGLIALLTPANLFTGVLGCGIVCFLNLWMDRRHGVAGFLLGWPLIALNLGAGTIFVALGFKAYWDEGRVGSLLILLGTLAFGWIGALVWSRGRVQPRQEN